MSGIIFGIIAGALMSVQGVMNTRLGEKTGVYEANVIVAVGTLILSLIFLSIFGSGNIKAASQVNKFYLLGGVLGYLITITVMLAIGKSSPSIAVSAILISQLLVAAIIEAFGIMGSEKIPFLWNKYVGLGLMIVGMILFKIK